MQRDEPKGIPKNPDKTFSISTGSGFGNTVQKIMKLDV
jgi:hypothetical protein